MLTKPKISYQQKLYFVLFVLFIGFTFTVLLFQVSRERQYKKNELASHLKTYCNLIAEDCKINPYNIPSNKLIELLPAELRISIITWDGEVIYDNKAELPLENHKDRTEIMAALRNGEGLSIRASGTLGKDLYYFAKSYDNIIVRTALVYDVEIAGLLKPSYTFIYFILILFILVSILLFIASDRFSRSIKRLSEFASHPDTNVLNQQRPVFPDDELGMIAARIVDSTLELAKSKEKVLSEKEKLVSHLHHSKEGIAIFQANHSLLYANAHFISNVSFLKDGHSINMSNIFTDTIFTKVVSYVEKQQSKTITDNLDVYQERQTNNGHYFNLKAVVFPDKSFEIIIEDITSLENNKNLKQEMTQSIAHELKTPVASVSAIIETLLNSNIDSEKRTHFLAIAYKQINRLSALISDIAIITKIEQAHQLYKRNDIDIYETLSNLIMQNPDADIESNITPNTTIYGSKTLLISIFENLIANSINYAGEKCKITIDNYNKDDDFLYFSFRDNGIGVPEKHLNRIFDRFYRIESGRDRNSGGTGLGLAIVKNAILFHNGSIIAKNNPKGGFELIFHLKKNR